MQFPNLNLQSENFGKRSSKLPLAFKITISILLVLLIYSTTDLGELLSTIQSISITAAIMIMLSFLVGQILSAYKWSFFVREVGLQRSSIDFQRAYFAGMFINSFAFGTVGGDVARCLWLKPKTGKRAATLATAIADRVHGLFVLTAIGAIAIFIVHPPVLGEYANILAFALLILLAASWLIGPAMLKKVFPKTHRFGEPAEAVAKAFPTSAKLMLILSLLSAIVHLLQIYMHVIIANELNLSLSMAYLLATVPIVNIISSLPLSINGMGVREALYIFLFVPVGVSKEVAVAFGAIWILTVTIISAIFGLLAINKSTQQATTSGHPKAV